jgi:hypothetical protein
MGRLKMKVITSVHVKSLTKGEDEERKLMGKVDESEEGLLMQEVVLVS